MIGVIQPVITELVLFLGGCSVLLMDAFSVNKRKILLVGFISMILSAISVVFIGVEGIFFGGVFLNNLYTAMIKLFLLVLTAGFVFSVTDFLEKYSFQSSEYLMMLMFMLVGVLIMVSSQHFMMLYLGMEIQALSAYTLASMQRKSLFASEAGVKYFILGSLASVLYLFGVSLLYGVSGALEFDSFRHLSGDILGAQFSVGAIFILVSMMVKLSVAPFHLWAPDVYQGAPTPSTAIFSSVLKVGGFAVLLRVLLGPLALLANMISLDVIVFTLAVISLMWGGIVPLFQNSLKRLLAHSAVGHVGFLLLSLLGKSVGAAGVLYVLLYAVTAVMIFIALISLQNKQTLEGVLDDIPISSLKGLSRFRPKHAFVLAVGFLSMAGLPPLIGFFPKLLILQQLLAQSHYMALVLAIIATIISLVYYLKLIKVMYVDEPAAQLIQPTNKFKRRLFVVFAPLLLLHILGGYMAWFQESYEGYIVKGVSALMLDQGE